MSIKLITEGKILPEGEIYPNKVIVCYHCRSVVEYDSSDIKQEAMGRGDFYSHIICPFCEKWIGSYGGL